MPAFFTRASSQRLVNSTTPVTAVPFTVGMWVNMPTSVNVTAPWSLVDTAGDAEGFAIFKTSTNVLALGAYSTAAGYFEATTATAITSNAWTYVVARAISTTNRRISVLHPTGTVNHAQHTSSVTPLSIDAAGLGAEVYTPAANFFDGRVAEYWMTASDVQRGGGQLDNGLLWQLARYGPLSVPHVRDALVEYLPFRDSVLGDKGDYYSSRGRRNWTNVNGVRLVAA